MLRRIAITVPMYASSNSVKSKQNLEKFCLFFILFHYVQSQTFTTAQRNSYATRRKYALDYFA